MSFKSMAKLTSMKPRLDTLPSRLTPPPKKAEGFYQSKEWRSLVAQIKRERGSFCERCGSGDRVIADHIVERKDGGADLDKSNIELLCQKHHNAKTAEARARRAKGIA
ncbi:HNH endonuclease [Agrobacterium vitis]|nr:HNH endonuclease [Agrobacterium vitis]